MRGGFSAVDWLDGGCAITGSPIAGTDRRVEGELWREFQADAPRILGGLLDAIVGGLAVLPSVRPAELPRMADFACLGEAVGRGLGWPDGTFLTAYSDNRRASTVTSLEDSLIAAALFERAQWGDLDNWTCSASEMLRAAHGKSRSQGQ